MVFDMDLSALKDVHCDKLGLYGSSGPEGPYTLMRFFSQCAHELKYIIRNYLADPEPYVFLYKTAVNGKTRQIVTYRATAEGQQLRQFHRRFAMVLTGLSEPHPQSYAYQKGKSIDACLKQHLKSDTFLKTDIHSYFDSISYDLLYERLLPFCKGVKQRENALRNILSVCFYQGHLPIGFVTSPVLSDIFLRDLDQRIGAVKGVRYTRYADDFIISASGEQAAEKLTSVLENLRAELAERQLSLNKKKTYIRTLNTEGDAIHLLGLNMVKTRTGHNRITVSQRYITETSKQLGFLLQNHESIEPWELRRQFVSVMGRVSFIVHSSRDSALKLKKLLRIKTGYKGRLTYKALSNVLLNNTLIVREYEQEKQIETYLQVKGICIFPASGRVWERVSIPADSQNGRNTLRRYLFSVCREFELSDSRRIQVNRFVLTVGNESISFEAPWNTVRLRALIRKIRTESTDVTYSADYLFDNGEPGSLHKYGKYYYTTQNSFRPLIALSDFEACYLYSEQENRWLFQNVSSRPIPQRTRLQKASINDFGEQEAWDGRISIDVRWPLVVDEALSQEIRQSMDRARKVLAPWMKIEASDGDSLCFTHQLTVSGKAEAMMSVIDSLQALSSLTKQANGVNLVKAWFVPAGFLEATEEAGLQYICVSTEHGRFDLRKYSV